jgi:hypothetical protein
VAKLMTARDVAGLDIMFEEGLKPALARAERILLGDG